MSLNFYQKEIIKKMLIFEQNPIIEINKKFNSEVSLNKNMYKVLNKYYKSIESKYKCNLKINCGILKLVVGSGKTRTILSYLNYINKNQNKIKYIDTFGKKTILYDDILDIVFSYLNYDFVFDISKHFNIKFINQENVDNENFINYNYIGNNNFYFPNVYRIGGSYDSNNYLKYSKYISKNKIIPFNSNCKDNLENYHLYINEFYNNRHHYLLKGLNYKEYSNVNLIIVPYKLVNQWKSESKVLNTECYIISKKKDFNKVFDFIEENENKYINIIINSNMVCHFYEFHTFIHFNKIIIDEPDSIKIKKSLANLSCNFMWLISATIERFNERGYGFNGSHISKNLQYLIHNNIHNKITISYNKEIIQNHMKKYTKEVEIKYIKNEKLKNTLKCYVNLYNNIDTIFAKESLGLVIDNYNNIFFKKYLINFIKNKTLTYLVKNRNIEKLVYYTRIRNREKVEKYEITFKKIIENIDNFNLDFVYLILLSFHLIYLKNISDDEIYISNKNKNIKEILIFYKLIISIYKEFNLSQCIYHNYLYKKYIKIIENSYIKHTNIYKKYKTSNLLSHYKDEYKILIDFKNIKYQTKYDILLNILNENIPTLIFNNINSQSKYTFDLLKDKEIKCRILKGNTNTINKILREYNNNSLNTLLLNSRNSGSGLNLTHTQNIIIMDKISKETEEQIIGRVKRYNQENKCIIYKLSPLEQ